VLLSSDSGFNQVTVLRNSLAGFVSVAKAALRRRYDAFIGLKDCYSLTNLILGQLFRSGLKTGWNGVRFQPFDRDVRSISVPDAHKVGHDAPHRSNWRAAARRLQTVPGPGARLNHLVPTELRVGKTFHFSQSIRDQRTRIWPWKNGLSTFRAAACAEKPSWSNGLPKTSHGAAALSRNFRRCGFSNREDSWTWLLHWPTLNLC